MSQRKVTPRRAAGKKKPDPVSRPAGKPKRGAAGEQKATASRSAANRKQSSVPVRPPGRVRKESVPPARASSTDPVFAKVRSAIHSVRPELSRARIRPEASLVADLGIDSLSLAQLSIALEDAFGRAIFLGDVLSELDDPASITVGQLSELVAREP